MYHFDKGIKIDVFIGMPYELLLSSHKLSNKFVNVNFDGLSVKLSVKEFYVLIPMTLS